MSAQVLDNMDLERERGITIKSHAVRLDYTARDGEQYVLNLIDTPGHVDFSYEVSRSLSACEGALLIVDASQGVEAQTLANTYLAIENNLELIPVINKIDLPGAEPDKALEQIEQLIGLDTHNAVLTSAKTGLGVDEVLEAIVRDVPPPAGNADAPLKALIFDSWYDSYRGVIVLFRVIDGAVKPGMKIRFFNTGRDYIVENLGVNRPRPTPIDRLSIGEVGFLTASIKEVADVQIGDTITEAARPTTEPFPVFRKSSRWSSRGCIR
jgi:GTP-binding protein LepA